MKIPIIAWHRGVGLHADQDESRQKTVKNEIDTVLATSSIAELSRWALDEAKSPESRVLAAGKLRAIHEIAAERRETRPIIDFETIEAATSGLDSLGWRSPVSFGMILDDGPGSRAVRRDVPLE